MAFAEMSGPASAWVRSSREGWLPIHRGHVIGGFLRGGGAARILLERLPGYVPELNPDAGIWDYLTS